MPDLTDPGTAAKTFRAVSDVLEGSARLNDHRILSQLPSREFIFCVAINNKVLTVSLAGCRNNIFSNQKT